MKKKVYTMMLTFLFIISVFGMSHQLAMAQDSGPYELDFWYSPSHYGSTEADVAEFVRGQLEDTGYFDVNVQSAEWTQYTGQFSTMGFFLLGWWFDYPDPSNYIDPFAGSGAFSLGTNYSSSTMDGYIDTMLTDPDQAAQTQAQKDAQELLAEDVPVVPLFSMINQFSGYQSDITGYNLEPSENVHYDSIEDSDNEITIGTTDSITNLDPGDAYNYFSSNTLVQLTHGLMEMPRDSTDAKPGPIVQNYTVNDDATVYTFNLKEGIQFSDGSAFNASVMKWNLERSIELGGDPGFLLSSVLNETEGAKIEATGDYQLKLTLHKPDATFLQRLTYTVAWPIAQDSLAKDEIQGTTGSALPIGLGPYKIDSWEEDTELILTPNEYYFDQDKVNNSKIVVKFYSDASALLTALETDEVDVAQKQFGPDEITSIKDNTDIEWQEESTAGIRYLVINVEEHTEKNVRQAIAAAVDREAIVDGVFNNLNDPLYSMVPEIFSSHVDAFEDGTSSQVSSLMSEAGYSTDDGGVDFPSMFSVMIALTGTIFVVNILRKRKY